MVDGIAKLIVSLVISTDLTAHNEFGLNECMFPGGTTLLRNPNNVAFDKLRPTEDYKASVFERASVPMT